MINLTKLSEITEEEGDKKVLVLMFAPAKVNEIESKQKPIWKTREDAKDYVTISNKEG